MNFILKKEIKLDDSWDVIVVGGGPSGCAAAAAAGREGAKTLLIEATGCLGGMATSGLVPAWCPFTDGEKIVYNGLARKVFEINKAGMKHVPDDMIHGWIPLDPEALKRTYDQLVTDYNVKVLFNTQLSAVEMQDDSTVDKIILSNKSGLNAFKSKVYIDCTGDGDLAYWAGAEYKKGADETEEMQPATLCFILSNVDNYSFLTGKAGKNNVETGNWVYEGSPAFKIVNEDKYPDIPDSHLCGNLIGPGTVGFNAGHIFNVDNTDVESVSKALVQGRKLAKYLGDALVEFEPKTFGNSYLAATASLMGIRETRRIIGDYILTIDDYLERKSFDDEISRNAYKIDIHQSLEQASQIKTYDGFLSFEEGNETHKGLYMRYKDGESHGIPYRCLTPKGIKNVLVAGRCISTDKRVQGSVRVMPNCLSTGEAAGIAAAHAVKFCNNDIHAVDIGYLRKRIMEEGGYLK